MVDGVGLSRLMTPGSTWFVHTRDTVLTRILILEAQTSADYVKSQRLTPFERTEASSVVTLAILYALECSLLALEVEGAVWRARRTDQIKCTQRKPAAWSLRQSILR